ncbi:hypothetical protein Vretimale_4546 [Volvox reticuliferus]|nr:hypothetical protein Vretimale_4546 [Volvox reticuliferus]
MSTSPRVSGVAISGPAGPSSPGPGPASGLARLVSRRSTSNMEGPTVVVCACCGGSGSGVGTAAGMASPRCGNGEAMEYLAGSLRDVRRDVDGRLGTLEEHGRSVMQLLTQLQAQVLELQQQQQQQQQGQKQQQLPSESGPLAQVDTAPGTAAATSSAMEALEDAGEVLLRDAMQRQQQEGGTADGSALLPRTPLSPPSRSRSPSRPSSAAGSHEARVETARYGVVVKTSDVRGAGTDADVLLTIYGSKGDTGERLLSNGTYNFERGQVSTFVFTAADVGEVERLRVRMRTQGTSSASPSWHLDAIQVASSATGTRYRFPHCGWVDNVLGRECVLYCKGTAPDTDEDPPGWQPTPPRSPPQHTRQQPQSPPQQQQQEQLPPPADRRDLPLSPSPTLTPRPTDSGRNSPSPLSAPPGLPSPPQDVAKSPVAPPGFVRGVVPSGSAPQDQPTADGPSGNAKNGADYNRGMRTDNDDKLPGGDSSVALLQLEERVAELQRRLLQMEEEQAEYAMRAAAATAAAVLVRMPAQLLAAVRYGRKGPGAAVGEAHHHRGSGGGGTAAAAAVSGSSDSDNALMLLADLLTHLHALAEQGVTAAATADTQAGVAAEAARRQQSRLMQMQFELTATSQAAEQTAKSCEQISQQLEAIAAARPPPDIDGEPISMAESGEDGVENSGNEDGTGPLAMEIRQCKARLGTVAADVKRLAVEQGSGAVTAATSKVEAVLAETRAFQARLATSLADIAASLSSQRQAWEQGSDGGDPVGLVETAGAEGGPALQVAMDALQHELLQMAKMVAGRTGAGARGTRDCASGRHGGDAGNRILNDDVLSGDDGDSVPSRGSYASA